jgi:hypothetical protein
MPCEQIKQLLAVSAREWSDAERALVEAHLLTCPACTALARDYANQERLLSALPRPGLAPARQYAILSQAHREVRGLRWQRHLSSALSLAAGMAALGLLAIALASWLRSVTQPTVATTALATPTALPTRTRPAPPTALPTRTRPAPPTAAPLPTIMLPDGRAVTATPATLSPASATEEAALQATATSSQATIVARATASPFPTAGPVTLQRGQPASASVQRGRLTFQVRLPKDTFWAGEAGRAEITFRNDSPETIFVLNQEPTLLDEQDRQPDPWPWEPMAMLGLGRIWPPGYSHKLAPGQVATDSLTFQVPPIEQAAYHSYVLWAETRFSRPSPANPEVGDDVWMSMEAGPIPLQVMEIDPTHRLVPNLQMDQAGWRLQVTDAAGQVPPGPLWGKMEIVFPDGDAGGPLQDNVQGIWSDDWKRGEPHRDGPIVMRAWVAAPGYVTAAVTQTFPAGAQTDYADRLFGATSSHWQTFDSLAQAQAALNVPLYCPTWLPASTTPDVIQVKSEDMGDGRQSDIIQSYRLPGGGRLRLTQMVTTISYTYGRQGRVREFPEVRWVTVGQVAGVLVQRSGWWILDWEIGEVGFELQAPASAISLEDLVAIAAGVKP